MNYPFSVMLIISLFFIACSEEPAPDDCPPGANSSSTLNIMPLGDSRVQGASPEFESYRYELWRIFLQNDREVNFIGSRKDEAAYERVRGFCFDKDHEGTGGATTLDVLRTLDEIRLDEIPQIVLLGIGGNDLLDGGRQPGEVIASIRQILDRLRSAYPGVKVYLEQIAPGRSDFMTPAIFETFELFNLGVAELGSSYEDVTVVDMALDWNDGYLADEVHYNQAGAKVVAMRYYAAINE